MATILGANSDSGYEISNSLRFNDDDSVRLLKAQSNGPRKFTWSWFKEIQHKFNTMFFWVPMKTELVLTLNLIDIE